MNTTSATAELVPGYLLKPDTDPPASKALNQIVWDCTEMSARDLSGNAEHWGKRGFIKRSQSSSSEEFKKGLNPNFQLCFDTEVLVTEL